MYVWWWWCVCFATVLFFHELQQLLHSQPTFLYFILPGRMVVDWRKKSLAKRLRAVHFHFALGRVATVVCISILLLS